MKQPYLIAVTALFLLTACDTVVSRREISRRHEIRNVYCTHFGYCLTCMPGLDGKMECAAKFSQFCDGSRRSDVEIVREKITFKSGAEEERDSEGAVLPLEECK